ncbi:MAG: hypothetical protein AAF441_18010 [Pseudomonadota bacterium]
MHFYLAAMEDPERFEPKLHTSWEEKLCWFDTGDGLPKKRDPEVTFPD